MAGTNQKPRSSKQAPAAAPPNQAAAPVGRMATTTASIGETPSFTRENADGSFVRITTNYNGKPLRHKGPCANPQCLTTLSRQWRKGENGVPLCDACGIYWTRNNGVHRQPKSTYRRRHDGADRQPPPRIMLQQADSPLQSYSDCHETFHLGSALDYRAPAAPPRSDSAYVLTDSRPYYAYVPNGCAHGIQGSSNPATLAWATLGDLEYPMTDSPTQDPFIDPALRDL